MSDIRYIDKDFVSFKYKNSKGKETKAVLVFGDKVEVLEEKTGSKRSRIKVLELFGGNLEGTVKGNPFRTHEKGVLKFSMVDVQQGDGMILETPPDENHKTKLMTIDGGNNKLFARHIASRYQHRKSSVENPLEIDLMLITHGDADHFAGLKHIKSSETDKYLLPRQRLFIHPKRIYHNGLVKSGAKDKDKKNIKETDRLGRTVDQNGTPMIVDLYDDPRNAPPEKQNSTFKTWGKIIDHWEEGRENIEFKRVAHGMSPDDLFGFLGSDIKVDIQGPFPTTITDPQDNLDKDSLPFFHKPKKSALIHLQENTDASSKSFSMSHTINGHSIAFRLTYGNVRFNFTGDLNQESMALMREKIDLSELESEIVKAPHHGSADFDFKALEAMKPVVSLISSGDESSFSEHIHPRATLVSALGKVSRGDTGIVLCTELAAFFAVRGYSQERKHIGTFSSIANAELRQILSEIINKKDGDKEKKKTAKEKRNIKDIEKFLKPFFAFERKNYGIIHVRTDGERVLVFTLSGKEGMREAYSFTVNENHEVDFADDVKTG